MSMKTFIAVLTTVVLFGGIALPEASAKKHHRHHCYRRTVSYERSYYHHYRPRYAYYNEPYYYDRPYYRTSYYERPYYRTYHRSYHSRPHLLFSFLF